MKKDNNTLLIGAAAVAAIIFFKNKNNAVNGIGAIKESDLEAQIDNINRQTNGRWELYHAYGKVGVSNEAGGRIGHLYTKKELHTLLYGVIEGIYLIKNK